MKEKDRRIEVFCGTVSVQVREKQRHKTREKNLSSERNHRKKVKNSQGRMIGSLWIKASDK
uniref:Uncharacterized protein n=1 Tax=Sinocyclocheilus grahami TaxID=75366 RepID=A0A672M5T3_SINGR